jgi:hypothetical protein
MLSGLATPVLHAQQAPGHQPEAPMANQHRRGEKKPMIANAEGASVTLWAPDLSTQPARIEQGEISLPKTGVDNYHAMVIEQDWGRYKEALVQYIYRRGKPSKESPMRLVNAEKTTFEVVPAPLPRGHYHYYTQQEWGFKLRFQNKPLANLPVVLETENGSRIESQANAQGEVTFLLPDDFPGIVEGERDRRNADFTVTAEHVDNGITYRSALNAEYRINQSHWQSLDMGIAVAGLGLLVGGFIGRAKSNKGGK